MEAGTHDELMKLTVVKSESGNIIMLRHEGFNTTNNFISFFVPSSPVVAYAEDVVIVTK